jgi:hypothetical protein
MNNAMMNMNIKMFFKDPALNLGGIYPKVKLPIMPVFIVYIYSHVYTLFGPSPHPLFHSHVL